MHLFNLEFSFLFPGVYIDSNYFYSVAACPFSYVCTLCEMTAAILQKKSLKTSS